jgi:hypothetical protein
MTTLQSFLRVNRGTSASDLEERATPVAANRQAAAVPNSHKVLDGFIGSLPDYVQAAYKWLQKKGIQQLSSKRLRVSETVALGEKRFVSILKIDGMEILVGSAAGQVSLLAILDPQQGTWQKDRQPSEQTA